MSQEKIVHEINPIDNIVSRPEMTTSAKIRALSALGMNRAQIALMLGKKYQHVRNVLITPIKKS